MESTTKITLTPAELSDITRATLGSPARAAAELPDGWFNTIFRIDLEDGSHVVIKLAPPADHPVMRYEHGLMETEVAVLRLLRDHGLPVPAVLAHDASGTLHAHEFFLMELVPGVSYGSVRASLPEAEREAIDRELGVLSARINAITGATYGRFGGDHTAASVWADSVSAMFEDVLQDAADTATVLPVPPDRVREYVTRARDALETVTKPQLVVWDLHPGNVFVTQGRVSGIIDCDRAMWGDPLMEFAFRAIAKTTQAFHEGYNGMAPSADAAHLASRTWLYDLYLALILVVECSFRGYAADHVAWARREVEHVLAFCPW